MAISIISGVLGFGIFLGSIIAAILNLSVLYVLLKGGFLKPNKSSIYIFAFSNISGYILQSIVGIYLGASSFAQDWLFPDGLHNFFVLAFSLIFLGQWFQEMFMQAIVAVDREYIFYGVYANTYISDGTQYNYVNTYINLPVNVITSGTALTCYLCIYIYVAKANRKVAGNVSNTATSNRKKKEVRYALQFAAMSCFILFSWLCFLILPHLIPADRLDLYPVFSSGAFLFFIHCCVNSFIFLTINTEFKEQFRKCMFSKASGRIFTLAGNTTTNSNSQLRRVDQSSNTRKPSTNIHVQFTAP